MLLLRCAHWSSDHPHGKGQRSGGSSKRRKGDLETSRGHPVPAAPEALFGPVHGGHTHRGRVRTARNEAPPLLVYTRVGVQRGDGKGLKRPLLLYTRTKCKPKANPAVRVHESHDPTWAAVHLGAQQFSAHSCSFWRPGCCRGTAYLLDNCSNQRGLGSQLTYVWLVLL